MTLLITLAAAVIATYKWYKGKDADLNIGILCFMFWGASIMWLVDSVVEYAADPKGFFNPGIHELVNDTFLGMSVVVLALVIWIVSVLIKDPRGRIYKALKGKNGMKAGRRDDSR